MAKKAAERVFVLFLLAVLVFCMYAGGKIPSRVYADTGGELNYDNTNVLDDLKSATVNGQPFDLSAYPRNPFGSPQVITFAEYCYSQYENGNGNYALYIYVYNPALTEFSLISQRNKIELSSDFFYAGEEGTVGSVKDYTKFPLKFCNASTGEYENRFLKFRIVDENDILLNAEREREEATGSRYYHIAGIELFAVGGDATTAQDYWVNQYYQFSGYAEGYGDSEKFPFQCDATGSAEAVELDVQHTFYRTETSGKGAHYQNQLDTVYFAVPKRLFDTYGKLQRIKAEWYEYKTREFIVTSNKEAADAISPYLGKQPDNGASYYGLNYALGINVTTGNLTPTADWGWNTKHHFTDDVCDLLTLMFLVDNIEEYDPYEADNDGNVSGNDLYDKMLAYDKSYLNGTLPIKDGSLSADLFESDIDEYRKVDSEQGKIQQGYSYYDFDADTDLQKLVSWSDEDPSFWENWKNYGFWDTLFGDIPEETGKTFSPIQVLEEDDLKGTDKEVSERLAVHVKDIEAIKQAYEDAVTIDPANPEDEECYLVLFRFATSDYYSAPVTIINYDATLNSKKYIDGQAYMAWESVFFDFDVIDLTFNKDGVYTVIPVVSDPIDIVNDLTSPTDMGDDGLNILALIALILILIVVLVVLMPVLPYIAKGIVWLVCLPFKAIVSLCKGIGKAVKERKVKHADKQVEKSFEKWRKQTKKKTAKTARKSKKVDVEKLKNDIWSGKKSELNLKDAERYALNHDEEWQQEQEVLRQTMYGVDDDDLDW